MINPMALTGKHILIAGASGGIGSETAVLASRLGAKLSLIGRNEEKLASVLEKLEGEGHIYVSCDMNELDGIEGAVQDVVSRNGQIDGMVNCTGVALNRPIRMSKPAFMQEVMQLNFFSFVELVRAITKKKNCTDGASLVGVSSVAAFKGNKAQGAYAASKAAIDAIIKPMAKEFADRNIRVNAAAFGMIRTDMYQCFLDAGGTDEELKDQYKGVGETVDAANVLCFLLSDASRFITGSTLLADGGYLS